MVRCIFPKDRGVASCASYQMLIVMGAYSLVAFLSRMIIHHAFLAIRDGRRQSKTGKGIWAD